jgi:hypothetical protein
MQEPSPARTRVNATNVLTMLLGVALVLGAILTVVSLKPGGSEAAFTVTGVVAIPCPTGEGAPACFQVLVQNTGSKAARVRCQLVPAAGTSALFLSGGAVYASMAAIDPQQTLPLSVKVDVTKGNDSVVSPTIGCSPVTD